MFKKLIASLKDNFGVGSIIAVWAVLVMSNFTLGTWLSGWDNLHPEFNFSLNIGRALSAAWQEYQGLGLLGGMAHAADLPRELLLWPVSLVVPASLIRYLWTFAMLLLGPLGVYVFVKRSVLLHRSDFGKELAGLIAGLFYLLNLGTVQIFFTPYEAFVTFYGFLPWLIYLASKFVAEGKRTLLFTFAVMSLLATAAFYVQTLFVVYLVVLSVVALEIALRGGRQGIKRLVTLLASLVVVNSFWLLPVGYFTLTNSKVVSQSHQNQIATPETQLFNEARGDVVDIAGLKGYWFDYYDLGGQGKFDYLYTDWMGYVNNPIWSVVSLVIFLASVCGLVAAIRDKENRIRFSGIVLLCVVYFMLATTNPPFGQIFKFIETHIPLFGEAFRNVFTKWSNVAAFVYALGVGYFIAFISRLRPPRLTALSGIIAAVTVVAATAGLVFPVFSGNLIAKSMRVSIPTYYFDLFRYMDQQPASARIALLPTDSFWGWDFFEWGYRGSGFLWYGVRQPILSRTFDTWSKYNETFYNQLAHAIDTNDAPALENVLKKFEVSYLVLDNSKLDVSGTAHKIETDGLKNLLAGSAGIYFERSFGDIDLYKTDLAGIPGFISSPESYVTVKADSDYAEADWIYPAYGNYVAGSEPEFPFASFDSRAGTKIVASPGGDGLIFKNVQTGYEISVGAEGKTSETFTGIQGFPTGNNCDLKKKGAVVKERLTGSISYAASGGGVSCDYFYYPGVNSNETNILRIKGKNLSGRGLKVYVQDAQTGKIFRQELFPGFANQGELDGNFDEYLVLLPRNDAESKGYIVNLETRSFGKVSSNNTVEAIDFYPLSQATLAAITGPADANEPMRISSNLQVNSTHQFGTWLYVADVEGDGLIHLAQGYDGGWKAIQCHMANAKCQLLPHTQLNGWANGWIVSSVSQSPRMSVYIVYLPQLLEYAGFVLLVGGAYMFWRKNSLDKSRE